MNRRLVIVPGWLDLSEPILQENAGSALRSMSQVGEVAPVRCECASGVPEAAYLGLSPAAVQVESGPLVVAALGAEPPPRSVHFHLTLGSLEGDRFQPVDLQVPDTDLRTLKEAAEKLNTSRLTIVWGEDRDHGLVWEDGSLELGTTPPAEPLQPYGRFLPQGDGEPILRRFIDDSVNLLSELELNIRRVDEGLPALNCLWPWGQGFRPSLPNLALSRGRSLLVESGSMRLQGLCAMCGYRHGDRRAFGAGTAVKLDRLAKGGAEIIVIDQIAQFRRQGKLEEAGWMTRELDRLFAPWIGVPKDEALEIMVVALGDPFGLALHYRHGESREDTVPFDERAIEDCRQAPPVWERIEQFLT